MANVLEAVTGEPWTPEQVAQTGERITNLQRVFSLKCGISGADDTLPKRLLEGPDRGEPRRQGAGSRRIDPATTTGSVAGTRTAARLWTSSRSWDWWR